MGRVGARHHDVTSGDGRVDVFIATLNEVLLLEVFLPPHHHLTALRRLEIEHGLEGPLPGAAEWEALAAHLEGMTAPAILAELRLDESAAESAEALSAHAGELARYTTLIRVHEAEPPRLRRERGEPGSSGWLRFIGRARDGEPVEERLPLTEEAVVALADAVGELVTLSRDFLGAYAEARPQE